MKLSTNRTATEEMKMEQRFQEFFLYTRIVAGRGSIARLSEEFSRLRIDKLLIVTDPGIEKAGILGAVKKRLDSDRKPFAVYAGVEPNPTDEIISEAYLLYKEERCQGILAVGGGSSIDAAKGVSVLASNGGSIRDYIGINVYTRPPVPLVAIPTTVGSGSDASWVLIMTLRDMKKKVAVLGRDLFPRVSILDPELVQTLPPHLTASTGMDVLSHAVEGYVSRKSNPISDALHRQVISLVGKNIRAAVANSCNLEAMGNMQLAGTIAGMAISNSGVGLAHAMSYPVSCYFGVGHGEANAILLPHVMRYNWIADPDKFADMVTLLGQPQPLSVIETARMSGEIVADLSRDVGIPAGLSAVGVKGEAVEKMADEIPSSPNSLNNPRSVSFRDVVEIYGQAL